MTKHETWVWQMTEQDTRDRHPTTLAAMHAVETAHKAARRSWRPSDIASKLPPDAQALVPILTARTVAEDERVQDEKGRSADRQRSRFNRMVAIAVVASAGAAALGAWQVFTGLSWKSGADGQWIAGAQLVCLAVASLFWALLWVLKPNRRWLADRGVAEGLRKTIFATVIEAADAASRAAEHAAPSADQPSARQLAYEYLRVCLLDDQLAWFRAKSTTASYQWLVIAVLRLFGLAFLASATAIAGLEATAHWAPEFVAKFFPIDRLPSGGSLTTLLTILGTTVITSAQAADSALLSARNRARYGEMARSLEALRAERLFDAQTTARQPAPAKGADDATLFARRLIEILSIEHAEWKAVLDQSTQRLHSAAPSLDS